MRIVIERAKNTLSLGNTKQNWGANREGIKKKGDRKGCGTPVRGTGFPLAARGIQRGKKKKKEWY